MRSLLRSGFCAFFLLAGGAFLPALQAQSTWNGSSGGLWSDTGNWTGPVPNGTAAQAEFYTAATLAVTIDEATSLADQTFTTGADAYTFDIATSLGFYGAGIVNNSGTTQTFNTSGTLSFSNSANAANATVHLASTGALSLNGLTASRISIGTLTGDDGSTISLSDKELIVGGLGSSGTIASAISGSGSLTKEGAGTVAISGNSDFSGGATLEAGTMRLGGFNALGLGLLTVNGGTLGNTTTDELSAISNDVQFKADISLDVLGEAGALEMFGDVSLGADATRTFTLTSDGLACFGGAISGQNLTLVTTGTFAQVMFCSNTQNVFTGTLRVGSGVLLQLDKDDDNIAVPGDLVIDAGATVETWLSNQFSTASNVEVNGTLRGLYSGTNTIDALTGTGTVIAEGGAGEPQTLIVGSGSFAGSITEGDGSQQRLEKQTGGTLILSGSSSYSGGTHISSGTLVAANDHAVGTEQVSVVGGTFLVASGVAVANTVKLSGGAYDRAFSGTADLSHAVDATSDFAGHLGATAAILEGTLTSGTGTLLQTSFAETSSALNDSIRLSDVYSLHGTGSDIFVLQLTMAGIGPDSYLAWLDTNGYWVNAVGGNSGGTATFINSGYDPLTDFHLGYYGINPATGAVWAVLNHHSDFAIVPEPSTWALAGLGLTALGVRAWRRRRA